MTLEKAAYIVSLSPGNSDYPQLFRIFLRHGFAALPRYRLFSLTVRTHRKDHPRREKKTSLIRAPEYPNLPSKAQESFLRRLGPSKRRATPSTKDISMNSSSAIRHCFTAALCLFTPALSLAQDFGRDKHDHLLHFEVPGSKATYPLAINEGGTVTGYYITKSGATSGFVRDDDGHITTFDIPGSVLTEPVSINTAGEITGYYELGGASYDPNNPAPLGFIRSPNGTITTFGGTAGPTGGSAFLPQPVAINAAGEVVGNTPDITYAGFVFIRSATGSVDFFTLSDGASYPTFVTGLNDAGDIVGYWTSYMLDQSLGYLINIHAPLPDPLDESGVTAISVPGSEGTFPTAINGDETVVGCSFGNNVYQDFVRYHDGAIETLNLPGTIPSCLPNFGAPGVFNVNPTSITINNEGTITGYYINQAKVSRGFVRSVDGKIVTFGRPEATQTIPTGINNCGVIIGYSSRGSVTRGFIRLP